MTKQDEVVDHLIKKNMTPRQIVEYQKNSVPTVKSYLFVNVGAGKIRRSDIYFSWNEKQRNILGQIEKIMKERGLSEDDWEEMNDYLSQFDLEIREWNLYK